MHALKNPNMYSVHPEHLTAYDHEMICLIDDFFVSIIGFNRYEICGQVLEQACLTVRTRAYCIISVLLMNLPQALTTGLAFCVSLVFAILIIIALVSAKQCIHLLLVF